MRQFPVMVMRCHQVLLLTGFGVMVATVGRAADGGAGASAAATERSFVGPAAVPVESSTTTVTDSLAPVIVPRAESGPEYSERVRLEQERIVREWLDSPAEPQVIYFPPSPPVLGAPLPGLGTPADEVLQALAPYVAEPFYAPLSTRLVEEDLGRRSRARLDAYRASKMTLLGELRATLEAVRSAGPVAHRQALAELATAQETALAGLEATADDLRREFFRARFVGGGGDWNRYRSWHLDPAGLAQNSRDGRLAELRVLRAAAYYQEGLSRPQRRLVRELAIELAGDLVAPGAGAALPPGDTSSVIFFSPDTARIPLPAGLPASLSELISNYTAAKDALKQELRHRLVAWDGERSATRRVRALQDLAGEQTVRLDDLETQAEAIREGLARWPGAIDSPASVPLPLEIVERMAAYLRAKSDLQKIAQERLTKALAEFDLHERTHQTPNQPARRVGVVRATVDAFHADHATRITALNAEAEAIRGEVVRLTANRPGAGADRPVNALLADFADAFKRQQLANLYADYRTAVLEPGLSPAQRRLLFSGALAELKLSGALRDQQVSPEEAFPQP